MNLPDTNLKFRCVLRINCNNNSNTTIMKTVFNIGRVGGIPISFHWTFLLVLMWIVLVNFLEVFQIEGLLWSILLLLSLFASILAHEFGHALVAKYFGIKASGIILLPIGEVANIPGLTKKPGKEILITLAGPAVNLIIAALLLIFIRPYSAYWGGPENFGAVNGGNFLFQLQVINFSLGIFNLIPAFPMDGGRMLRILLGLNMDISKARRFAGIIGKTIAIGLIIWGIILINLLLILIGICTLFASSSKKYYLQLRKIAKRAKPREVRLY